MGHKIDVKALIDTQEIGTFQVGMLIFSFLAMMIDSFDAFSIAYVAPSILAEWQVPRVAFTAVFTGNVVGLALGAIILGPVADRIGNKLALIIILFAFGILTIAKAFVGSVEGLTALQFAAALPVGGAYPIALSIVAENTPLRRRAAMLVITSLGFTLGATLAGFLAGPMIASAGWRGMFYVGGALALVLGAVAIGFVPDSLQRLVRQEAPRDKIVRALLKIVPFTRIDPDATFVGADSGASRIPVAELFADGRAIMTIILWFGFVASFMVYYFLFSWLPIMLNAAGMSINQSLIGGAIYPVGGFVGGLLFAYLSNKQPPAFITSGLFVISTLSIIVVAFVGSGTINYALFLVGLGSVGGILASNALVSLVYPAEMRSAGIGWAFGVGRLGSMLGPLLGGLMLGLKLPLATMCFVMAVPAAISAVAFLCVGRLKTAT